MEFDFDYTHPAAPSRTVSPWIMGFRLSGQQGSTKFGASAFCYKYLTNIAAADACEIVVATACCPFGFQRPVWLRVPRGVAVHCKWHGSVSLE